MTIAHARRSAWGGGIAVDLAMALAMIGMSAGPSVAGTGWAAGFALLGAGFLGHLSWLYIRDGRRSPALGPHARHAVLCAAMVYLLAAPSAGSPSGADMADMSGMGGGGLGPALLFAAVGGIVLADVWRLAGDGSRFRAATCCRVAVSVATVCMLAG